MTSAKDRRSGIVSDRVLDTQIKLLDLRELLRKRSKRIETITIVKESQLAITPTSASPLIGVFALLLLAALFRSPTTVLVDRSQWVTVTSSSSQKYFTSERIASETRIERKEINDLYAA
jgi:hypothetical protein